MSARGRFISLEGGEGVGKSTQVKALARALEDRGVSVLVTREPGGSGGAEAVRELLLQGDESRWCAQAEALLFAAARAVTDPQLSDRILAAAFSNAMTLAAAPHHPARPTRQETE